MKKLSVLLLLIPCLFASCKEATPDIASHHKEITLLLGEEKALDITLTNCEWNDVAIIQSDNIVLFNKGNIKAIKPGKNTLQIMHSQNKDVFVNIDIEVLAPIIDLNNLTIVQNDETLNHLSFTNCKLSDFEVQYDQQYLQIKEHDNNLIITGLKTGTTTVTYTNKIDSTISYTQNITITSPLAKASFASIFGDFYQGSKTTLSITITIGSQDDFYLSSFDCEIDGYDVSFPKTGEVKILLMRKTDDTMIDNITLTINEPLKPQITVIEKEVELYVYEEKEIEIEVQALDKKDLLYTVHDDSLALISDGKIFALKSGSTTVTITWNEDESIRARFKLIINVDPMQLLSSFHIESPYVGLVTTYGEGQLQQMVYGSVSLYLFDDLNLITNIVPITPNIYQGMKATSEMLTEAEGLKLVRSGILHEETTLITYHDTGNNKAGANALMHANYLIGDDNRGNRARSWHYTVDDECVYYHIPDNEVTWQGDAYLAYAKSIGIETCVDYGSDLYLTWQRTAKLIASLMARYNINIDGIKQHYDFNKKNCPQTLRMNGLYQLAKEMIAVERIAYTHLRDYTITFTSLSPEYLSNNGRVLKLGDEEISVSYRITIKKGDFYQEETFTSLLSAKKVEANFPSKLKKYEFQELLKEIIKKDSSAN